MRTGENNRNLTELEKKAGQKAARNIGRIFRATIKKTHYPLGLDGVKNTGEMLKTSGATAVMKFDALDHIAIRTTKATFINHYGFEGIKSNGAKMHLKAQSTIDIALNKAKDSIERLADDIGGIRAEEITSKIRW